MEKIRKSSALDKQTVLNKLSTELEEKRQKEISALNSSHEKELRELGMVHRAEIAKLRREHNEQITTLSRFDCREELRKIKLGFEKDKQNGIDPAVVPAIAQAKKTIAELEEQVEIMRYQLGVAKAELETRRKSCRDWND